MSEAKPVGQLLLKLAQEKWVTILNWLILED